MLVTFYTPDTCDQQLICRPGRASVSHERRVMSASRNLLLSSVFSSITAERKTQIRKKNMPTGQIIQQRSDIPGGVFLLAIFKMMVNWINILDGNEQNILKYSFTHETWQIKLKILSNSITTESLGENGKTNRLHIKQRLGCHLVATLQTCKSKFTDCLHSSKKTKQTTLYCVLLEVSKWSWRVLELVLSAAFSNARPKKLKGQKQTQRRKWGNIVVYW